MKKTLLKMIFGCSVFSGFASSKAHSDIHHQLGKVTQSIEKKPSAELLVYRADLLIKLRHLKEALKDVQWIESQFGDSIRESSLLKAQIYFLQSKSDLALNVIAHIEQITFGKSLTLSKALKLKSKIYFSHGNLELAVRSQLSSLKAHPQPEPDMYLNAFELLSQTSHLQAAQILEEGIQRLGLIAALVERLILNFEQNSQFEAALSLTRRYVNTLQRKEHWLLKQAHLELKCRQSQAAAKSFQLAEEEISQLPVYIAIREETQNLRNEVKDQIHLR